VDIDGGRIGGGLPDRIFRFPFVLKDLDVDLHDGAIRVRGRVGIGTGAESLLFTIGQFDVRIGLSVRSHHDMAYVNGQLSALFTLSTQSTAVDALPGTDIDELPAWVWLAIAPFAPTLSGWAALVAAFEAVATPLARDLTETSVAAIIGMEAVRAKDTELGRMLDQMDDLTPEQRQALEGAFWLETDDITIEEGRMRLEAFAGVWTTWDLAGLLI